MSLGKKLLYSSGTIPASGEAVFKDKSSTNAGANYNFIVPDGVTSICVVLVGPGAGRQSGFNGCGGGALRWANNIPVTPGQSIPIQVGRGYIPGTAGTPSFYFNATTLFANGGNGSAGGDGTTSTTPAGASTAGGGNGGAGSGFGTGGGAGGYGNSGSFSAAGGAGAASGSNPGAAGTNGAGGGGGGATGDPVQGCGGGGGVGMYGRGTNGAGGTTTPGNLGGKGGSGGVNGRDSTTSIAGDTGEFGGGAGSRSDGISLYGGPGVVRIIWGAGRAFPSTNTTAASSELVINY